MDGWNAESDAASLLSNLEISEHLAWEYYDLENDPMELSNQYNNIKNKKIISQLKRDLLNLRTKLGDEKTDSDELKDILKNHWE